MRARGERERPECERADTSDTIKWRWDGYESMGETWWRKQEAGWSRQHNGDVSTVVNKGSVDDSGESVRCVRPRLTHETSAAPGSLSIHVVLVRMAWNTTRGDHDGWESVLEMLQLGGRSRRLVGGGCERPDCASGQLSLSECNTPQAKDAGVRSGELVAHAIGVGKRQTGVFRRLTLAWPRHGIFPLLSLFLCRVSANYQADVMQYHADVEMPEHLKGVASSSLRPLTSGHVLTYHLSSSTNQQVGRGCVRLAGVFPLSVYS